ncbi:telomere binding protein [Ophidiomyces ophidiicola]|uniref:telomere binding protein n=1 Tax=Ophidiomyces ophidiicola TaxID=1387563 RepID=UPI0020C5B330|nr:telomere binding protein [Ophidiomyces ophidiicola]KAI1916144.1 telomere binding protein [Ophidiomyces ophidiicola]KAI1916954.1 telomere binding protein [Ophidiomyces ophidiicola]KAI1924933.1 telomere binding protein [Ophidiomyces ophidiicola]KAI1951761.1 telomere binding protein [Ophidiomyces ophidiicola]KAI2038105.1 telomere binding protein [Ophidiomyces ophidiicola]
MDSLLTAVKTVDLGHRDADLLGTISGDANTSTTSSDERCTIDTPEEALRVLTSEPSEIQFLSALNFLDPTQVSKNRFDITVPEPPTVSIVNSLVSLAINHRWAAIEKEYKSSTKSRRARTAKAVVLRCLTSVGGIGALIANLRTLLDQLSGLREGEKASRHIVLRDNLSALSNVLHTPGLLFRIYQQIARVDHLAKRQLAWSQLMVFLASSRVLSTAAETLDAINDLDSLSSIRWIGDGKTYASWLGHSIVSMALSLDNSDTEAWRSLGKFTQRASSLGYLRKYFFYKDKPLILPLILQIDDLSNALYSEFLLRPDTRADEFRTLMGLLDAHSQKRIFGSILHSLENSYLSSASKCDSILLADTHTGRAVGGVAAIVALIIDLLPALSAHLIQCLVKGVDSNIRGIMMRRALVSIFASRDDVLSDILNKATIFFGDELYIKHAPLKAQEANSQIILLIAGYLHRCNAAELATFTKSGTYLSAITHRIGASLPRSRFLGMAVGMGLSKLTDSPDKALKFQSDEMQTQDALWYINLITLHDKIGSPTDLVGFKCASLNPTEGSRSMEYTVQKAHIQPKSKLNTSRVINIEEVPDSAEDEDIYSYEKPDSDASDSEDDPTLIQRSKPSAPVYIRDLVSALRDTENPERYNLAIASAPNLIRRKTGFGTEIIENANDLALSLVSLQDKYDIANFHENHLEGLVALITALPNQMGHWMTHALFNIDLSLAHRSVILISLGVSARELAGFRDEDTKAIGLSEPSKPLFPSKKLPRHFDSIYSPSKEGFENISKRITQEILEPLALSATDTLTGPNIMKLQPLYSQATKKKQNRDEKLKQKQKHLSKDKREVLSNAFLLPLLREFDVMMYTMRSFGNQNPFLEPHLVCLFIQTVTLLFFTFGPYSPDVGLFTREILSLLITLHNLPVASEPIVLPAILSLLLTVLDINIISGSSAEERLVTNCAASVIELREWVEGVFERTPAEEERVRALSAGILVKLEETTSRYQGRLLGLDSKFQY